MSLLIGERWTRTPGTGSPVLREAGQVGYRWPMTTEPPAIEPDPATEPHTDAQATAPGADAWANRIETAIANEHQAEEQREAVGDDASGPGGD